MAKNTDNTKNVTFTLPVELVEKFRKYVEDKQIPSVSAGVREALSEYSHKIDKDILHKKMRGTAKDPLFMEDLEKSMKDFEDADNEMNRGDDKW